jgi:hypothetical protein
VALAFLRASIREAAAAGPAPSFAVKRPVARSFAMKASMMRSSTRQQHRAVREQFVVKRRTSKARAGATPARAQFRIFSSPILYDSAWPGHCRRFR